LCGPPLPDLDIAPFYVSTSQENSYNPQFTVLVGLYDWIDKNHDIHYTSHLSPENLEILSKMEIELKMSDRMNGFKMCAKIPDPKYYQLIELTKRWKIKMESEGLGIGEAVSSVASWDPSDWLRSVGLI